MIRAQDIENIILNLSDSWIDILCEHIQATCLTVYAILNTTPAQIVFR